MPYKENLKKAKSLKEDIDLLRPLTPEMEKRIMQKFHLDWNYHSSHIEGNTLTYSETKALILFGQTAQAKPLKDHLEMSGHNEAIKSIEEVIRQERPLTESFIRELHIIILKEPYEINAITPEGKPTKKIVQVGKYKTTPNHVKTKTGEIFYFASPEETPAKMKDLMNWYNQNLNKSDIDAILFATEFHYRFIRIHPFDDGNGRIARLLMNFILMQKGHPPAIIKTEDKENYFNALEQADAGQIEYFFNYICEQVISSLELMIKGAKGESIEEEDDLDKKIALLKQKIDKENEANEVKTNLSVEEVKKALNNWGYKLLINITNNVKKFNEFYYNPNHTIKIRLHTFDLPEFNCINEVPVELIKKELSKRGNRQIDKAVIEYNIDFGVYKKGGINSFSCKYVFKIIFQKYQYEIFIHHFDPLVKREKLFIKKLLHKPLNGQEIKEISSKIGNTLYQHFEYNINNLR
ncbi:MAG: Fic family protein [Bacteroidales bacterium]|nr:Fic family protein [Bacteroidales bacterium]